MNRLDFNCLNFHFKRHFDFDRCHFVTLAVIYTTDIFDVKHSLHKTNEKYLLFLFTFPKWLLIHFVVSAKDIILNFFQKSSLV
jgi:hypothetical protein